MDFNFSEDQQQLRDAVRRWVDKAYTFEHSRAAVKAGGFSRDTWAELADLGLTVPQVQADFAGFVRQLHDHLHELAQTAQPQGLHTFGQAPEELHRLGTVLLMLGQPFWEAAAAHAGVPLEDVDEALVGPGNSWRKPRPTNSCSATWCKANPWTTCPRRCKNLCSRPAPPTPTWVPRAS